MQKYTITAFLECGQQ